jgi:hypothetical protein
MYIPTSCNLSFALSHPCIYGRGNIRVMEDVVELEGVDS